jgi:hypothetical protein
VIRVTLLYELRGSLGLGKEVGEGVFVAGNGMTGGGRGGMCIGSIVLIGSS